MTTMTTRPEHHKQSSDRIGADSTAKDIVPTVVADVCLWIGLSKASGTDHIVAPGILGKDTRLGLIETLPAGFVNAHSVLLAR